MNKRLISVLFIFFLICYLPFTEKLIAQNKTAQQIASDTFPATVLLVMEDTYGQPVSLGSGFFVRDGIIATNLHVIEGARGGYAKIIGQKKSYNIDGIIKIDPKRDIALLAVSNVNAPSLKLGDSDAVNIGDTIYAVGNPQGLEGTFSSGIISGIRQIDDDQLLQITAPISPGNSGGPVLNEQGQVIGIAVATYKSGQNLNFAVPINYLKPLLDGELEIVPFPSEPLSREHSIFESIGEIGTEGVTGGQMTWDSYSQSGDYSFTLRNRLKEPVEDIYCLIIFYDANNIPIDFDLVYYEGIIPPGLGKRINSRIDASVEKLNSPKNSLPPRPPQNPVEFRILDFTIVEW
jgi:hypothetical protein